MALYPLRILWIVVLLLALATPRSEACYGPKIVFGVESGVRGEFAAAVLALYLKEKTGIALTLVPTAAAEVAAKIAADELDAGFAPEGEEGAPLLGYRLLAGVRLVDDLQFTTVLPALHKLSALLQGIDPAPYLKRIQEGEGAGAAARLLLFLNGWI